MLELAIGLGVAAGGILATNILWFILLRSSNGRGDRAESQATTIAKRFSDQTDELERERESHRILDANNAELLREIGTIKTSHATTEAELASVKASRDDLVRTLSNQPGALPPLVRGALERLRAQVSAAAGPAPADHPNGGKEDRVHDPDALEPPE